MPEIEMPVSQKLIETIQNSRRCEKFDLPDGGMAIVTSHEVRTFYPDKVIEPEVKAVILTTLEGLANYAGLAGRDLANGYYCQVTNPGCVKLFDHSDPTKPIFYAAAQANLPKIDVLSDWVSLETAQIQIQELFLPDDGINRLVEVLSSVRIEDLVELKEGISKEVNVTTRITTGKRAADANVEGLKLRPLRTFPEVATIESSFSMRWNRTASDAVSVRLVERDRLGWQYNQMIAVAEKMKELLPSIEVLV